MQKNDKSESPQPATPPESCRNIEIKGRVHDYDAFARLAEKICDNKESLVQKDTYFICPNGRLKLRQFPTGVAEMIFYQRANDLAPKESTYQRFPILEPGTTTALLAQAYGIRGVVKKKRTVFHVGQTRVHLDDVERLGTFMELEVVLKSGQTLKEARDIADELIKYFQIIPEDMINVSYIDLLEAKQESS